MGISLSVRSSSWAAVVNIYAVSFYRTYYHEKQGIPAVGAVVVLLELVVHDLAPLLAADLAKKGFPSAWPQVILLLTATSATPNLI